MEQKRMSLSAVTRGRIESPMRVLIYGTDKIGKSTFAADAPSTIFLGTESGTKEMDVARMPEPRSWVDILEAVDELAQQAHTFRTLAIDSLDWIEPLCWAHVCATKADKKGQRHENIEHYPYGAGYALAVDVWRDLLARLDVLVSKKRMHVVLIAHASIKKFANPEGDDFERYQMKLHEKSAALIREWVDATLFATYETLTHKADKSELTKVKGVSTGARIAHTERRAAFDAGNRYGLPDTIPLGWSAFENAVAVQRTAPPVDLRARIDEALRGQAPALIEKVQAAVVKSGDDAQQLAKILNHLTVTVSQSEGAKAS